MIQSTVLLLLSKRTLKKLGDIVTLNKTRCFSTTRLLNIFKLSEVGVLSQVKKENYETGQLFVHRLFGYRGVVLFPWTANVIEKPDEESTMSQAQYDKLVTDELELNSNGASGGGNNKSKSVKLTYYQVLIDNRDIPYIRSQPESVTFLGGPQKNRSVYSIHGLDYVSHHDLLPYNSTEKVPIIHDLFDKFLMVDPESKPNFVARESLKAWQESNHPWLELSDVSICTTNNVRITVIPFYIGIKEDQSKKLYWWRYSIRIENLAREVAVTLRERHWKIFSRAGTFETVRGKGVVGQEPFLNDEQPVFQYSSHVNLQAPSGHMWGTFKMEKEDGSFFDVRIPSFQLESKDDDDPTTTSSTTTTPTTDSSK